MHSLLWDVRFAFRLIRRAPAFFATLLAVLVAGIGATTAMFSIVESLLLKPLPYPHPEQLTMVWREDPRVHHGPTSILNFLDWKQRATTFESMAAIDTISLSLSSEGAKPESVPSAQVSGDFFPLVGVQALRGRLLQPEDDRVGGARVAVVSASLWHRRFGSDPDLVGKTVVLSGEPYTVVGIAPEGFRLSSPHSSRTDVWTPLAVSLAGYAKDLQSGRGNSFLQVYGRRKAGVSLELAQSEMTSISEDLQREHPGSNAKKGVLLESLHDALVSTSRSGVWVLFAAVALVFVIVCSNVANLLLTRAQSRRAEMAARAAIGATSTRLARQVLTETVVVFLIGALGGAVAARWLVDLFASGIVDSAGAKTIDIRVDAVALLFCVVTCLVCGVVFGLVPALGIARVEPQTVLKESASRVGVGRSQRNVRSALVVAQVALACVLLVGSGLALRAFQRVASNSPGFDPGDLATAWISLPDVKYADDVRTAAFVRDAMEKIAAQPGVQGVTVNNSLPMGGSNWSSSFSIEGRPHWPRGDEPNLERNDVPPGYFATMGVPLLRGRDFTDADRADGRPVMIVSQATAERFFPGEDPVGHRIDWGDSDDDDKPIWREIVGVVGDVRRNGLDRPVVAEGYTPYVQHPDHFFAVVARTPRANELLQALPGLIAEVDPLQAVRSRELMSEVVADTIYTQRHVALLLACFAAAALLLATLGVFGLVSYSTSQRRREIGIRMALGSTPEGVVGLVVNGGLRLVGAGLVLGLAGAVLLGRVLSARVPGVTAFDLAVYLAIPALLGLAGLLACLVPAWRAVRITPASALRYE
jgi:putative ABC transport system permease protein